MTTTRDVIDRTRVHLMGQQREPINTLSVSIDADDEALTFTHAIRFIEGSRLSIGLETMLVVTVSSGGAACTVIRGIDGSVGAAHTAGDKVYINPTWTSHQIFQAVNDELADLSAPTNGLFRISSMDFTYNLHQSGYEITGVTDFIDVWRVRYSEVGPTDRWPLINRRFWHLDRAADTTQFPSGIALQLDMGGWPGQLVRVSMKVGFDALTAESNNVLTASGLHEEAHDILSLGAAYRLMGGSEAQRSYSTAQADPRRGDEASSTAHARSMQSFAQMLAERIRSEQSRLARQYPESLG